MTHTTTIFNQDCEIGTIWANTKADPIELYERREGMFKFIGWAKAKNDLRPRHRMNKPHDKDLLIVSELHKLGINFPTYGSRVIIDERKKKLEEKP